MLNIFNYCTDLVSVTLSSTIKSIGTQAFRGCSCLKSIIIPKSITSVNINAFENCSALASIVVEEGNTVYDSREQCNAIIKTETNELVHGSNTTSIPNTVKAIGRCAFGGRSTLQTITIPNSVTCIGDHAFQWCNALDEIISEIKVPFTISSNVFAGVTTHATLCVPAGTKAKYEATNGWKEFQNIKEIGGLEPIQGETTVATDGLGSENLSDNVVNDVYYNVGAEGYDSSDQSIVINQPTNMSQISDATPGSNDVKNNFTGLILKVAAGKGLIKVNAKTTGNAQLVVQVGNQTPMIATKTEQGDVVASYDVTEDTYVYIYAIIDSSAAPALRAAGTDVVKIYAITVTPGATGIDLTTTLPQGEEVYYTLDGRKVFGKPTQKGLYIRNGRKVVMK